MPRRSRDSANRYIATVRAMAGAAAPDDVVSRAPASRMRPNTGLSTPADMVWNQRVLVARLAAPKNSRTWSG